ncbi:MAG: FHA domain-containing protein [Rhodobacteraceae bacterium]|nr:FHA domain-containing protein [Paracoccaceae bacterium]
MRLAYFLAVFFALTINVSAADKELFSMCSLSPHDEQKAIDCTFRSFAPKSVKRVEIEANGTKLTPLNYIAFDDSDEKAAWLFLIDRSNPRRNKTVQRSVELVKSLYAQANAKNIMAVATFADDLQVLVSPGDPYVNVDERLKGVKADGAATAFYFTAIKGIDILQKVDADRRALVIISDGKAEDTAYSHKDVIKRAKESGVVIYGIGFSEKASETVELQQVERLASETGGPFASAVGSEELKPADFVSKFRQYLTNGGQASAPLNDINGEIKSQLKVIYNDGTTAQSAVSDFFVEPPAEPEPEPVITIEKQDRIPELPLIGKIYQSFDTTIPGASEWARQNQELAWLFLLLPAIILAVLLFYFFKKTQDESGATETEEPFEDIGSDTETPVTVATPIDEQRTSVLATAGRYGYFETLEETPKRFEINEQNVTIGRHSENDFQLDDETVHRHHAVFHISPENRPVITDLDTVNGVMVNGQRISKIELNVGDLIELGEAKFRFFS